MVNQLEGLSVLGERELASGVEQLKVTAKRLRFENCYEELFLSE
jgi:hypothetical protein